MNKKIKKSVVAAVAIAITSSLFAGTFEYDGQKGWWWYKEVVKKNGKTYEIKTKFTTKEKLLFEQREKQNELLQKQTKLLTKINERLQYAFPNLTPKYGINKKTGEKCLANSSADCFVMPVQPEAQHIPVLAKFLRDPNPKNSEEYLKWQAKYFNHVTNVSYGIRFAYLSGGANAYPTDAIYTIGDNPAFPVSDDLRQINEFKIMHQIKDKIGIMIFLGKNTALETANNIYNFFYNYQTRGWKNINVSVVFPSEKMKEYELKKAKEAYIIDKRNKDFWNRVRIIVNPELFKKFNINVTPSVLAVYKLDGKKRKYIWQNIAVGTTFPNTVREGLFRFLVYNKIIDPKDLSATSNSIAVQKNVPSKPVSLNERDIYKETKKMQIIEDTSSKKEGKQ